LALIGDLSRSLIVAAHGHMLVGGDFTSIESIVMAWLADEQWKLQAYRDYFKTRDPTREVYSFIACKLLGLPPGTVTKADKLRRKFGKVADLAFGYGGSINAWRRFDPDGVLTEGQAAIVARHSSADQEAVAHVRGCGAH
jgi:DNA polymerase